jgi:SH3-like domain-containing protein
MHQAAMIRRPLIAALLLLTASEAVAQTKTPPYWAAIVPSAARTRTGPGRNFPAVWMYKRAGLPVKVVQVHEAWRKVEDPDGAQGWMQANMLTDKRTAMVMGEVRALRDKPAAEAAVVWRVEPGVVGRLRRCESGWCELDIAGKRGWVETAALWGVAPSERYED